jgi:hypothetical protein
MLHLYIHSVKLHAFGVLPQCGSLVPFYSFIAFGRVPFSTAGESHEGVFLMDITVLLYTLQNNTNKRSNKDTALMVTFNTEF